MFKPILEIVVVFVWFLYPVELVSNQNYNSNVTFDIFLARIGGPTATHATTLLIFLSVSPIAVLVPRSIIAAFLTEVLAFKIHEGLGRSACGWMGGTRGLLATTKR